jgi:TorA maturation chaperone TorD
VSSSAASAVAVDGPIAAEDRARANFYALLGRLYAAAPDAALLRAIAEAGELPIETSLDAARGLADAWRTLIAASAAMDAEAAAQEYVDLFIGVGRSEVSLHAAEYLHSTGGNVLADLRSELSRLGLARQTGVSLYEDHLAAALETMRVLIAGGPGVAAGALDEQRAFFTRYVASWVPQCCNAIKSVAIANYYRRVAEFTEFFVAIERDSFAIE